MSQALSAYGGYSANTLALYQKMKSQAYDAENGLSQQGSLSTLSTLAQNSSPLNLLSQSSQATTGGSITEELSSLIRLTRYAMDQMGLESDSKITFSALNDYCQSVQDKFSAAVEEGLSGLQVDFSNLSLSLSKNGTLSAQSSSPVNAALAQIVLDSHPNFASSLTGAFSKSGISLGNGASIMIQSDGKMTSVPDNATCQAVLDSEAELGALIASSLQSERVDPKLDFSLKTNEDDSVTVNCADAKYSSLIQAFFQENPSLISDYQRSDVLSKIEEVRKSMQLSPSDMRTRLQLESMVAWWDSSEQSSTSSFGIYSGGAFSQLHGINLNV
ncbi:MAG: hypothetical protein K5657_04180 [Desulfovibrio sp.]|nr:hypothetical protein [Desulfovibrio sp.]